MVSDDGWMEGRRRDEAIKDGNWRYRSLEELKEKKVECDWLVSTVLC